MLGHERVDERGRVRRVVAAVGVSHDINVSLDIGEHAPHDIGLAAPFFAQDAGAGERGGPSGIVSRIVVEHVDARVRQRLGEAAHSRGDRARLIAAGQQDGDVQAFGKLDGWHCGSG
jgi:hypothetical protein